MVIKVWGDRRGHLVPAGSGLRGDLPGCCGRWRAHRASCSRRAVAVRGLPVAFHRVWSSFSNQRPFPSSPQCSATRCSGGQSTGTKPSAHEGSGGDHAGQDTALLPVRSLLPEERARLGPVGACAHSQPGAGWSAQSLSYWGFFSGPSPGCCRLPGCRLGDLPASPVAPRPCPGHAPAEVITSCRLKTHRQSAGIIFHRVPQIVGS